MAEITKTKTVQDYKSNVSPIWCPGCGDFAGLNALYRAFLELDIDPKKTVIVSGIGCSGRLPIFTTAYGFHGIHGRVLPTATGVKLANPELTVIATGGDGDGLAIGGGHFPHACRRNIDITYIMLDNSTYGLTKGQGSPTTTAEDQQRSNPYGLPEDNLNPVGLALAYNASFVARAYAGNIQQMVDIYKQAILHKGFSFVHELSPCVVFNDTYKYYKGRVDQIPSDHDPADKHKAIDLWQVPGKTYLGLFYKREGNVTFQQRLKELQAKAVQQEGPGDIEKLLSEFV